MPNRGFQRRNQPGSECRSSSRTEQVLRDGERDQDQATDELLLRSLSEIDQIEGRLLVLRKSISVALRRLAEDRRLPSKAWAVRHAGDGESTPRPPTSAADSRPRLVRLPEVIVRVGLSRSCIYALVERGEFPRPVRLAQRSVAWWEPDLDRWIESRVTGDAGSSVEPT